MRAPAKGTRPRKSQLGSIPVPTAGWISNRNLAIPTGQGDAPGAQVLDNWFPTASSARLRRGTARYATMTENLPVKSLFTYSIGEVKELFAANDQGIWNLSSVTEPYSAAIVTENDDYISPDGINQSLGWSSVVVADNLWPSTNGDWITTQFSTAGGTFLIGVNGQDEGWIYDGQTFEALDVTFPAPLTTGTDELSFVWAYKRRLYFIHKNSLDVWYLPIDSIGGEAAPIPLGAEFSLGGSLLFGSTWSLSSGGDGGLSEQNVFVSTEGEAVIYQGLSPDSAETWSKVGVYRIGRPMGKKAFIRAGGDLVIATTIGFVALSQAIDMDYAALGIVAVSAKIADAWRDAVSERGPDGWVCELWAEGSMTLIAPPHLPNTEYIVFVANSDTGAWTRFTGWRPVSMETWRGNLYFGTSSGTIQRAWIGGSDEGAPYTGTMLPLFYDLGTPGQRKVAKIARAVTRSRYGADKQVSAVFDWSSRLPAAPNASLIPVGNEWGNAIWGQSVWGAQMSTIISEEWKSVGGSGYAATVALQVTSGSTVPLDVELVRLDLSYETGDIIS